MALLQYFYKSNLNKATPFILWHIDPLIHLPALRTFVTNFMGQNLTMRVMEKLLEDSKISDNSMRIIFLHYTHSVLLLCPNF